MSKGSNKNQMNQTNKIANENCNEQYNQFYLALVTCLVTFKRCSVRPRVDKNVDGFKPFYYSTPSNVPERVTHIRKSVENTWKINLKVIFFGDFYWDHIS